MFERSPMNYFMCITTLKNWEITSKTNILGFTKHHTRLNDVIRVGDKGIIYVKTQQGDKVIKKPIVVAEFKVTSNLYFDDKELFAKSQRKPKENYPVRCKIKITKKAKTPILFKKFVALRCFEWVNLVAVL